MTVRKNLSLLLATAVLVLPAKYVQSQEQNYTEEVVDGVKKIHNLYPKFRDESKFELEFVQKIGQVDGNDENFQFYRAIDATMDSEGNLYIMDSGNFRIQVFDPNGNFLRTIGRQGEGPGEFQNIWSIDITVDDKLFVNDRRRYIHQLELNGTPVESSKMEGNYSYIRMTGSGTFCAPIISNMVPNMMAQAFDGRTKNDILNCIYSVTIRSEERKEFAVGLPEEGITFGGQINANTFETDNQYNVYVAYKHQNRIEKYSPDGKLLLEIDRPLGFNINHGIAEVIWRSGSEEQKFPQFSGTYVSGRIGVDSAGRIWVATQVNQPVKNEREHITHFGKRIFDVFSPEGVLLTRVPHPDENLIFIKLHGEFVLFKDKNYLTISKYKIVEQ